MRMNKYRELERGVHEADNDFVEWGYSQRCKETMFPAFVGGRPSVD